MILLKNIQIEYLRVRNKNRVLSGEIMTIQRAIKWFEDAVDVFTIFPIENDEKLEKSKKAEIIILD